MNLEKFVELAPNIELASGWKLFQKVIERLQPGLDHLIQVISRIQEVNPELGNLLVMDLKLYCADGDFFDGEDIKKTLDYFQSLEKSFMENGNKTGLEILCAFRKEYPETLGLLEREVGHA